MRHRSTTRFPELAALACALSLVAPIAPARQPTPPQNPSPDTDPRLPDFSFAGYAYGESQPPRPPVTLDVTDFGAVADAQADCTDAFRRAIDACQGGVILIPAGTYRLSDILWIERPDIVLRGQGPDETVLLFTNELEDVRPNMGETSSGRTTSNYSWSGGFLWVRGSNRRTPLAAVTGQPTRGTRTLTLDAAPDLHPGDTVELVLRDNDQRTLLNHLYADDPGDTRAITAPVSTSMIARVVSVDGPSVTIDRPLWLDVRAEWAPTLHRFEPTVSNVGIEDLAIEFPAKPYAGHFTERGMNAIAVNAAAHCWVRNVRISNADSGIFLAGVNCTIDGLLIDSARRPSAGSTGHHAVTLGRDCLLTNFDLRTRYIHDITVSNLSTGNVVSNGRGVALSIDHHKRAPYQNLFCNLDAGDPSRFWASGGGASLGRHAARGSTFWSIRADRPIPWPPRGYAPRDTNLIAMEFQGPAPDWIAGWRIEPADPAAPVPADLPAFQRDRRLGPAPSTEPSDSDRQGTPPKHAGP